MSVAGALGCVVRRDLTLAMRGRADVLTGLIFFVIVASLFPMGMEPDPDRLKAIAPGVVWVAALLASMLALGRLFASDFADGTLEQMLVTPWPLSLIVLGKVAAHWLSTGLPLVLIAPVLGMQYGLPAGGLVVLVATLLLGTPVLSLIGAIGAALTVGLRSAGVLVSVLVLPLYVPVLIFGAGAVRVALEADVPGLAAAEAQLSLLGAFLVLALFLTPWATAAALRVSLD